MTPAAIIMTSTVVLVVVWGLLNRAWKRIEGKRYYVVPDEQAFHTRIIRLRRPRCSKGED